MSKTWSIPQTDKVLITTAELARLREIERIASHAGILLAQEQHNAMMSEKDAEIASLRANSARWEWIRQFALMIGSKATKFNAERNNEYVDAAIAAEGAGK